MICSKNICSLCQFDIKIALSTSTKQYLWAVVRRRRLEFTRDIHATRRRPPTSTDDDILQQTVPVALEFGCNSPEKLASGGAIAPCVLNFDAIRSRVNNLPMKDSIRMNARMVTNPGLPASARYPVKLLLSVPEAAAALSIGQTVLWRYVGSGALASVKVGRSRRIKVADLERFVADLGETS